MIDNLKIEAAQNTPMVSFDYAKGELKISGVSTTSNAVEFYNVLTTWIKNYQAVAHPTTTAKFYFKYYNTSSSKCILGILNTLVILNKQSKVVVNWYYDEDDEDMLEGIQDYVSLVDLDIKLIPNQ